MMKTEVLARMYRGGAAQRWQRLSGYGSGAEESRSLGLFICRRMLRRTGGTGSSPQPNAHRRALVANNQPPTGCQNRKKPVELTGIEPVTS